MRTNRYVNWIVALIATIVVTTVSCKDDKDDLTIDVALSEDLLSLVIGTSETLTATMTPSNTSAKVTWTSGNTDVATVTADGVVNAVGVGKTVINAKAGSGLSTCDVIVTPVPVDVIGITLEKPQVIMTIGDVETLEFDITPLEATNKKVRWSSSNSDVVTVHKSTGEMTAKAFGDAVITVTTLNGEKTATCAVSVLPLITLTGPADNTSMKLNPLDATEKVTFSWTANAEFTGYDLLFALTEDFETPLFTFETTTVSAEFLSNDLNDVFKNLSGDPIKVYWTVKPKSTDMEVITATRILSITPDRNDYLKLLTGSASGMTITQAGTYQYSIKSSVATSSVNSEGLITPLMNGLAVLSFKYNSEINQSSPSVSLYKSGGALAAGPVQASVIYQSEGWKEWSVVLNQAIISSGWGSTGDYLKFDFNDANGYQIELNGIHFRKMTAQEQDNYEPEYLKIASQSNHVTVVQNEGFYYSFISTGTDPYVLTAGISKVLPESAVILSFEYRSNTELKNNLQVFIGLKNGPGLAESRSIKYGTIPASKEWKEYNADLLSLRKSDNWGATVGDYLRIDFGENAGLEMEVRNIHFKYKN